MCSVNLKRICSPRTYQNGCTTVIKGKIPKMPPDMGYKLGKAICASYYDNSTDKEQAVFELLNTDNFGAILSGSDFGYLAE